MPLRPFPSSFPVILGTLLWFSGSAQAQFTVASGNAVQVPDAANVDFHWDQKIPLRGGVRLSAKIPLAVRA